MIKENFQGNQFIGSISSSTKGAILLNIAMAILGGLLVSIQASPLIAFVGVLLVGIGVLRFTYLLWFAKYIHESLPHKVQNSGRAVSLTSPGQYHTDPFQNDEIKPFVGEIEIHKGIKSPSLPPPHLN